MSVAVSQAPVMAKVDECTDIENSYLEKDIDEDFEIQGFLWMCGLCSSRPTFETVVDLFDHKKTHSVQSEQALVNRAVINEIANSDLSPPNSPAIDYVSEPESPSIARDEEASSTVEVFNPTTDPASPASSDDVPLSNIAEKLSSLSNKDNNTKSSKSKTKTIKVKVSKEPCNLNSDIKNENVEIVEIKCDNGIENWDAVADAEADRTDNTQTGEKSMKKVHNLCKICFSEFRTRAELSKHKKTHLYGDTGEFKCGTCGKLCPKYDNFTRHLTIHFKDRIKQHQCSTCSAAFFNLADLKRHSVLHADVKPFTCEHCGEGFTRLDNLHIHESKHTGIQYKKYACKGCDKILNSPSALVMHMKTHSAKSVFCPEPECKFSCYLQSQLRQHLRKHSGEKPFQCSTCGRCFARSNDMKNHISNVHERIRPFKCSQCSKDFALVSNLRIHYLTHTNERPYLCAQCGKCFNHPSTMRKHSVIMHNPWRAHLPRLRRGPGRPVRQPIDPLSVSETKESVENDNDSRNSQETELYRKRLKIEKQSETISIPIQISQEVQTDLKLLTPPTAVAVPVNILPTTFVGPFIIPDIIVEQVEHIARPNN